jgi:hypothetical protein
MAVTINERLPAARRFEGRAFGIALGADFGVPGLLEPIDASPVRHVGRRQLELTLVDDLTAERAWPAATAERTFVIRRQSGRAALTIDRDREAGYRVWVAGLGQCVISAQGDRILCCPSRVRNRWQLLIGQGLPIAAALQGLEVLHASAVRLGSMSVAFIAPSGTGKTSLALHLLAHGAAFLADDVVALEADADAVLTHPGIGLAHAPQSERALLQDAGVAIAWQSHAGPKQHVRVAIPEAPVPLGAAYFLERTSAVAAVEISPIQPPDPCLLLAATFVSHVPTAERLITQLDVCSRIARSVPLFLVRIPFDGRAADLAERVVRHIRSSA